MKLIKISSTILTAFVLLLNACSPSKKSSNTTAASPAAAPASTPTGTTTSSNTVPVMMERPKNGVFSPGNEELTAIQTSYTDVSMQTLLDGYNIYKGVCTKCHGTKSIYSRATEKWQEIINDMAKKANITDVEKDAVYKYVLAIKATQGKSSN